MATWQVRFQRYNRKGGETRLSGITHLNADTIDEALRRANDRIDGMKEAAPDCEFRIAHLLSHDFRGTDCTGGIRLFETAEEMSQRLIDEANAPIPPARTKQGS